MASHLFARFVTAPASAAAVDARAATTARAADSTRRATIALIALLLVAWFSTLELRGLFIPDEGRYAEIPREMLASGDWVTPRLNGLKYFEKPPLQYWLTAATYAVLGEDEWTARLPSTLLGFFALCMTAFTARRLWGAHAGLGAALLLGSGWAFYLSSQYLTLDIMLSAFLTFALCSFLLAQSSADHRTQRRWMLAAWLSCALAVLSKGLIGIVLPGLVLVIYSLVARQFALWRRLHLLGGITLLALVTAPWFLLVQQRNPEFFEFFFVYEHFKRFTGSGHGRGGAWWYYLPILIVGLMPWTPALLQRAWSAATARASSGSEQPDRAAFRPALFCALWSIVIVGFFSLSQSKLPAYVMPVFPALALLATRHDLLADVRALRWSAWGVAAVAVIVLIATTQIERWTKFSDIGADAMAAVPLIYIAGASLLAGAAAALWLLRRTRRLWAVFALLAGSFAFWGSVFFFLHEVDTSFSSERLIESLTDDSKPFDPAHEFYSVAMFDHSLPFYLGRTLTLVDYDGETSMGRDIEPGKRYDSIDEFALHWRQTTEQAYAVMRPAQYEQFVREGLPMTVVARDRRLVIVSRENEPVPTAAHGS